MKQTVLFRNGGDRTKGGQLPWQKYSVGSPSRKEGPMASIAFGPPSLIPAPITSQKLGVHTSCRVKTVCVVGRRKGSRYKPTLLPRTLQTPILAAFRTRIRVTSPKAPVL